VSGVHDRAPRAGLDMHLLSRKQNRVAELRWRLDRAIAGLPTNVPPLMDLLPQRHPNPSSAAGSRPLVRPSSWIGQRTKHSGA
jgi:hypothetical protein